MNVPCEVVQLGTTDIIAMVGIKPVRIQVKTSRTVYEGARAKKDGGKKYPIRATYHFSVAKGSKTKVALTEADCDILALVGLDHEGVLFLPMSGVRHQKTKRVPAADYLDSELAACSWNKAVRKLY
ncbi:MAG: hypothetical protein CMP84_01970 [Gammaproteobacteria bacterium]|nr:hypothetical protein [Gammaproteobacteria bacterium]